MATQFPELIGRIMNNCGALELLTNNAIKVFARDQLLANEVVKLGFAARINLLSKLLIDRKKLPEHVVKSVCAELSSIGRERNKIAHNPIACDNPEGTDPYILVVRHKDDPTPVTKLTRIDLEALARRSNEAIATLVGLVPESKQG